MRKQDAEKYIEALNKKYKSLEEVIIEEKEIIEKVIFEDNQE